jgi:hypothetical protein
MLRLVDGQKFSLIFRQKYSHIFHCVELGYEILPEHAVVEKVLDGFDLAGAAGLPSGAQAGDLRVPPEVNVVILVLRRLVARGSVARGLVAFQSVARGSVALPNPSPTDLSPPNPSPLI